MKIYQIIKKEHEVQRNRCEELKKELEAHAVTEERYFYFPLIHTDKMQEDARHGMAELIRELNDTEMSLPHCLATVQKLVDRVNII